MNGDIASSVALLGWALVHFLWQGLLLGAVAGAALMLLRNARPQARYAVACLALALCLALPLLTMALSSPEHGTASPMPSVQTATTETGNTRASVVLPAELQQGLQSRLPLIVALWSLGAALLSLRMALGLAWVARADRAGVGRANPYWQARLDVLAQAFALPRRVLLRVVDDLDSPVAARIWRPVVLLPAALIARLPPDLLEALLAHELAHIKRHDYLVNLMQSAIEALLFYHPVVWWLSRQIRIEREQIADDLAARTLGDPRRLARALDQLAQLHCAPHLHLAPAAHGGNLMSRIQRLVRPRQHALNWRLALPIFGLSVACVSVFAQGTAPAPAAAPTQASVTGAPPARTVGTTTVRRADDAAQFMLVGRDRTGPSFISADYDQLKSVPELREQFGDEFLWFRRDSREYVVRDAALVAQAREAWSTTQPVSEQMDALGDQMQVHGKVMEEIGDRMEAQSQAGEPASAELEALGSQMEKLAEAMEPLASQMEVADSEAERNRLHAEMERLGAEMNRLGAQMDRHGAELSRQHAPLAALGAEMDRASEPMAPLSARMDVLGKQMDELSRVATQRTQAVIDQALRDNKAIAVDRSQRR